MNKILASALILCSFSAYANDPFDAFYGRMRYLGERDKILSQNIANADTPNYQPKDLSVNRSGMSFKSRKTHSSHFAIEDIGDTYSTFNASIDEIKPNGNSVNLDRELFKKGENSLSLNETMNVYAKTKSMLNTAIMGASK